MFILMHGIWKDNLMSVILDWRQRSASSSSEGRDPLGHSRRPVSFSCMCSSAVVLLRKKSPRHRRKIYANSLWLYSYYKQSLPRKNKNINYIFIYLRVFRCLSSGAICNMWTTPSLLSLLGPFGPGAIIPVRVLSMGPIELCFQIICHKEAQKK